MGPETGTPARTKLAPHRRFFPTDRASREEAGARRGWRGLYHGEPENCRRQLRPFLLSMAQLGLLLVVFQRFQIEGRAFLALVSLSILALPFHYLAPYRWKKPLLAMVSISGLYWIFGTEVASIVVGLAAALIGICFLPVSWNLKASLVAGLAICLAIARGNLAMAGLSSIVWPVLATMFMFRMILYLYELKHARAPESLIDTINYFFLLPNFSFMHFPVVDYRTLQRGYFAADVHAIQRRGLQMMFRGTIQLIGYRIIYHDLLIPPGEVYGAWSLAGYLVCNYLLYLRVSGQFHMACGMLHLFGYQLPDTHHMYLLATSFTDYWRRINIYWKDFMVRVFFNPVVFRLKRWPQPAALALATLVVFVATWALHAYQSYWLRGTWGFSTPDALFWGILGILVLINVQVDARRSRSRKRVKAGGDEAGSLRVKLRALTIRGIQTACTFTTIALLWSLWSSPSVSAWLSLMSRGLVGV